MKGITRLPRTVYSSLRSSVIFCDLTRVVEELIYNSLDAGATKVYVSVDVGTCYIKVEDNGCGITRDGLVLLGERHATSKLDLSEMDVNTTSLGFRGEALGSLSDVSLLEVVTKAAGRPNGYHKVMKDWKCLSLEIDDRRQDVGTTVIVRDLFYNWPVRRKCMQSSPKKVLHSVKKCVLRASLVYPLVSFKVIDIIGEDVLLCTVPSSSPLPLVKNFFGNEVSSCLQELTFHGGPLKLSGYISGPADNLLTKALQYIYINSRFVYKCPIHKLLNNLAMRSHSPLAPWRDEPELQSTKRHKVQGYPAYLLNLCCPLSSYDLTFEPSKTIIEFKDWVPILSFIEQAVMNIWKKGSAIQRRGLFHDCKDSHPTKGVILKEGVSVSSRLGKKKYSSQVSQNSLCHSPKASFRPKASFLETSPGGGLSDRCHRTFRGMWEDSDIDDHTFQNTSTETCNVSNAMCDRIFDKKQSCHQWGTDADFFSMEENIFSKSSLERHAADRDNYGALDSAWGSESHKVYETSTELFTPSTDMHNHYFCKNDREDPFLLVSPRQGDKSSLRKFNALEKNPTDSMLFSNLQSHGVEFDIFRIKEYEISSDDIISIANSCSFEVDCSYLKENLWDEKAADPRLRFGGLRKCQNNFDVDLSPENSPFTECFAKYRNAVAQVGEKSVAFQSTEQGQCSGSPLSIPDHFLQDADYFTEKYATIEDHISRKNLRSRCFSNGGVGDEHVNDIQNNSVAEDFLTMNSPNTWRNWFTSRTNHRKHSHFKHPLHEKKFSNANPSSMLDGKTDETFPDFSINNKTNYCVKSVFDKSDDMSTSDIDMDMLDFRDLIRSCVSNLRSRRSYSAPPFYKGKNKYSLSQDCFNGAFGSKNHENSSRVDHTPSETSHDVDNPLGDSKSYGIPIEVSLSYSREHMKRDQFCIPDMKDMEARHLLEHPPCFHQPDSVVTEDIVPNKLEEPNINLTKWRNGEPQPTDADLGGFCGKSHMVTGHEDDILDVSSGPLHLAGGLLVPQSISRDYLLNATVLQQQLDKKFIPVMAGGVLAIVDQHAADERIRLEELRRKVLSGEGKETTFLESEQELMLPETGLQLLQNYTEQIHNWGWICDVHAQRAGSFTKNLNTLNKQSARVHLVAVPCILGINLTDKDLMEFLQQLAETDGSSAVPPSVLRVLSFKACRGAIMFGDSLLPSECSLIIEELKETSLCFQCAHGRPTTVPLISLPALRKQLARLELQSGGRPERWHGLRRQAPSHDRARLRLSSAKGLKA